MCLQQTFEMELLSSDNVKFKVKKLPGILADMETLDGNCATIPFHSKQLQIVVNWINYGKRAMIVYSLQTLLSTIVIADFLMIDELMQYIAMILHETYFDSHYFITLFKEAKIPDDVFENFTKHLTSRIRFKLMYDFPNVYLKDIGGVTLSIGSRSKRHEEFMMKMTQMDQVVYEIHEHYDIKEFFRIHRPYQFKLKRLIIYLNETPFPDLFDEYIHFSWDLLEKLCPVEELWIRNSRYDVSIFMQHIMRNNTETIKKLNIKYWNDRQLLPTIANGASNLRTCILSLNSWNVYAKQVDYLIPFPCILKSGQCEALDLTLPSSAVWKYFKFTLKTLSCKPLEVTMNRLTLNATHFVDDVFILSFNGQIVSDTILDESLASITRNELIAKHVDIRYPTGHAPFKSTMETYMFAIHQKFKNVTSYGLEILQSVPAYFGLLNTFTNLRCLKLHNVVPEMDKEVAVCVARMQRLQVLFIQSNTYLRHCLQKIPTMDYCSMVEALDKTEEYVACVYTGRTKLDINDETFGDVYKMWMTLTKASVSDYDSQIDKIINNTKTFSTFAKRVEGGYANCSREIVDNIVHVYYS